MTTTPNPAPVTTSDAERDLAKIYDAFSIGSKARIIHILMENLSNVLRRERCLAAIERTFFMVPTEPDEEDEGVPGEECLLNWGQDPDEYVRTFRAALKTIAPTESKTVFLVATGETHDGQETYTRHDVRPFLCDAETLYTAPSPALPIDFKQATDQGGWQPIATAPHTRKVLVSYLNSRGKRHVVMACYYEDGELPMSDSYQGDKEFADAGWYEECETADETIYPVEGDPTDWHEIPAFLPAAPTLQGVADGDAVGGKSGGAA